MEKKSLEEMPYPTCGLVNDKPSHIGELDESLSGEKYHLCYDSRPCPYKITIEGKNIVPII
ncbi:MAG: hypothetical protein ACOYT4_04975 [Nanoarchaeota archaeon]